MHYLHLTTFHSHHLQLQSDLERPSEVFYWNRPQLEISVSIAQHASDSFDHEPHIETQKVFLPTHRGPGPVDMTAISFSSGHRSCLHHNSLVHFLLSLQPPQSPSLLNLKNYRWWQQHFAKNTRNVADAAVMPQTSSAFTWGVVMKTGPEPEL